MRYDSILFDLDGTLWDATEALQISWAMALKDAPDVEAPPTKEELEKVMGMTAEDLMATLYPNLSPQRHMELFQRCCEVETLDQLSRKVPLFIVSNCNTEYIPSFLDGHKLHKYFQDWECIGRTGRPKGENIQLIVERNGLKRPVYVGDTILDQEASAQAGVPFLHAAYGFGKVTGAPEVESPEALLKLLED